MIDHLDSRAGWPSAWPPFSSWRPVRRAGRARPLPRPHRHCPPQAPASVAPASVAPSAPASAAAGEAYEVKVATGTVGKYLTGEDGKTLYIFKKDTTAGKSACNGDCATNWPPFLLEAGESTKAGDGVTGTLATITRDDGTIQVTYNGAPVYYFAADKATGDTTGQGVGGIWFVANP